MNHTNSLEKILSKASGILTGDQARRLDAALHQLSSTGGMPYGSHYHMLDSSVMQKAAEVASIVRNTGSASAIEDSLRGFYGLDRREAADARSRADERMMNAGHSPDTAAMMYVAEAAALGYSRHGSDDPYMAGLGMALASYLGYGASIEIGSGRTSAFKSSSARGQEGTVSLTAFIEEADKAIERKFSQVRSARDMQEGDSSAIDMSMMLLGFADALTYLSLGAPAGEDEVLASAAIRAYQASGLGTTPYVSKKLDDAYAIF